jgi:polyisoprenoid-binding protein YceI
MAAPLLGGCALLASTLLAQAPAWQVARGQVAVRCPLTVGGSFDARTDAISGRLAADPARPSAFAGEVSVDLQTLDTGIGLRNTHLRENYLEVGRGNGYDRAVLSEIVLASGDASTFDGRTRFAGVLTLHGTRKPVNGEARIRRERGGAEVEAEFPVSLPAHGIAEPRYLGVGVRDEVQVKVTFTAAVSAGTAGSR